MKFVDHEWTVIQESELAETEKAVCPHCDMIRETVEGETTYKFRAHTPSGYKPALVPPGAGWPEPSCKTGLRALGQILHNRSIAKELDDEESCCVAWGNPPVYECGGPAICDHDCHKALEVGSV